MSRFLFPKAGNAKILQIFKACQCLILSALLSMYVTIIMNFSSITPFISTFVTHLTLKTGNWYECIQLKETGMNVYSSIQDIQLQNLEPQERKRQKSWQRWRSRLPSFLLPVYKKIFTSSSTDLRFDLAAK